jgi:small subunit ribosomal protein S3Ae
MAKPKKAAKAMDKWKMKKRFEVLAPDIFNKVSIGPIFADEGKNLLGRTVETTLSKLVNSNQHHIKVMLRVVDVSGFNALTQIDSVELSRSYLSSHISPGTNIIDYIFVVKTKDGKNAKCKLVVFTRRGVHEEQKKQLRKLAEKIVRSEGEKNTYDQLMQELVFGKLGSQIFNKGKKIVPLGRVEIYKAGLV